MLGKNQYSLKETFLGINVLYWKVSVWRGQVGEEAGVLQVGEEAGQVQVGEEAGVLQVGEEAGQVKVGEEAGQVQVGEEAGGCRWVRTWGCKV